jgi:hypothetical protein
MKYRSLTLAVATLNLSATAAPNPTITDAPNVKLAKRASSLPASSGTSVLKVAQTIAAGESFDSRMVMFDRGLDCTRQDEGGDSDAVFQIGAGGSLSNVIIGPNQIEGVHCHGACTLTNVWSSAVCEDAFSIKKQSSSQTTYVKGAGVFGADDKVVQHNGAGTVSISAFVVEDFGKLYRSCGNCDLMYKRHVIMDGFTATSGSELAGKFLESLFFVQSKADVFLHRYQHQLWRYCYFLRRYCKRRRRYLRQVQRH